MVMSAVRAVGPWTLHEKLGKGGNADVWRARRGDEEVALKVIHSTKAKSEQYRRFVREVEFLRSIPNAPGVLPLVHSHLPERPSQADRAWLAMPVATPIAEALEDTSLEDVVAAIAEIASTLARLRAEHDVAHRDIKPGNLYCYDGQWCVGDFGLIALPNVEELTRTSRRLGPAHYTAYELILDPGGADPFPADVYSLGKTLWALATGLGFPPEGHQPAGTRSYSINDLRPHPNAAALDRLVDRATRLHAEERPTMQEVASDLEAWRDLSSAAPALDVSGLGAELRKRLEGQIAAEDLHEQRREFALVSARKLQELVQHLNDALIQVIPRAEIGISGEPSARTLLHTSDGFGRELVVWKFDRTSRISAGERHFPFDFSFGVGLNLTESGTLVFNSYVLVATRGVMGSEFFWQGEVADAPVGSVTCERMLEEKVAELTEQFKTGLEVFAEKAAQETSG
jgi:serine/threonine protein kinase